VDLGPPNRLAIVRPPGVSFKNGNGIGTDPNSHCSAQRNDFYPSIHNDWSILIINWFSVRTRLKCEQLVCCRVAELGHKG